MISGNGIASFFVWVTGEQTLLTMARSNFFMHLDRISKTRTHTFLSNNAQNENGVSRNFGADRYYCWEDTMIDCRNAPRLIESDVLRDFTYGIAENPRFLKIKTDLEKRMGGFVAIEPFYSVLRGEDNMRYNIRHGGIIEDFDIVRIGLRLHAKDEATFKQSLGALADSENPFKLRAVHPLERGLPA